MSRRSFSTPPSGRDAPDYFLNRGVWRAPWLGQNGELVLIAITRDHKLCGQPLVVSHGASQSAASAAMRAQLDRDDPGPDLRIIKPF